MNRAFEPRRSRMVNEELKLIDERCDLYERDWNASVSQRVENYLGGAEGEVRTVLWLELVMLDQQLRQKRRQTSTILDYEDGCPDKRILLDLSSEVLDPFAAAGSNDIPSHLDLGNDEPATAPGQLAPLLKTFRAPATSAMPARGRRPKTPPWPLASRRSIPTCPRRGPTPTRPVLSTCRAPSARAGKAAPPAAAAR